MKFSPEDKKPAVKTAGRIKQKVSERALLLPRALLVPVRLEPLAALVLRHFQPTFLFQIAHGSDK
jgi:hypothetical protein